MGSGKKGDTIYLRSDFDPANLGHRGAVVRELVHAEDDKAAAGPRVQNTDRARHELRAYRRGAKFLLDTIRPLTGAARAAAIRDATSASVWTVVQGWAMALEARADRPRFEPILRAINAAAPAAARLVPAAMWMALESPTSQAAQVEAFLLREIERAYGMTHGDKILQDGLSGESILDWINRPRDP